MADAARDGPWIETLEPLLTPAPVHEPAFYHRLLAPVVSEFDLWETTYFQLLDGENPVAEWTKGTWLRPMLDALGADRRAGLRGGLPRPHRRRLPARPGRPDPVPVPAPVPCREAVAAAVQRSGWARQVAVPRTRTLPSRSTTSASATETCRPCLTMRPIQRTGRFRA